ncbi:MAG: radical SAM protein, partial [Beijerinckiaceae bacterium]|nr:radical SAM protein [Beijerinckiaceae bacterium]
MAQLEAADLRGHTRLLILQGTPFCNIDCSYCYLPHRGDRSRMDLRTVRQAVAWVYRHGLAADPLTLFWHAGEPLTLPPEWYERAIAHAAPEVPDSARIEHRLQTNATLIDDRWCALFLAHKFNIGVSLDGPAWLHDARRR